MTSTDGVTRSSGMSRRGFLAGTVGSAATLAAAGVVTAPAAVAATPRGCPVQHDGPSRTFSRIFPELEPFARPSSALTAALLDIGRPGGIMDAKDPLEKGALALALNASLSVDNPDNPTHTEGTHFMGQFLDHDITFDPTSSLNRAADPESTPNLRTPAFDLDSVYGDGPVTSPHLYDGSDWAKLRIESGGRYEDVPRVDGRALIGDPRNDSHFIISGLHAAFIKFHNAVVDRVRATNRDAPYGEIFAKARRLATQHYQWMVLHEFLPLFVGQGMVDSALRQRRFFRPRQASIPVEFSGAAYRFGHSMIRPSYGANFKGNPGNRAFFAFIFDAKEAGKADPEDFSGGVRAPRRYIDWQLFFDFQDGGVRRNKRIDTRISTPLFQLPLSAIASHDVPQSLPQRSLLRHVTWSLPSGQDVARRMDVPVLSSGDLSELKGYGLKLERSTPLWYYVLKEAQLIEDGLRLGPMGGRIVAEVFVGLLEMDPDSILNAGPRWRPTLPDRTGKVTGDFRMVDMLTLAGVDPASRAAAAG